MKKKLKQVENTNLNLRNKILSQKEEMVQLSGEVETYNKLLDQNDILRENHAVMAKAVNDTSEERDGLKEENEKLSSTIEELSNGSRSASGSGSGSDDQNDNKNDKLDKPDKDLWSYASTALSNVTRAISPIPLPCQSCNDLKSQLELSAETINNLEYKKIFLEKELSTQKTNFENSLTEIENEKKNLFNKKEELEKIVFESKKVLSDEKISRERMKVKYEEERNKLVFDLEKLTVDNQNLMKAKVPKLIEIKSNQEATAKIKKLEKKISEQNVIFGKLTNNVNQLKTRNSSDRLESENLLKNKILENEQLKNENSTLTMNLEEAGVVKESLNVALSELKSRNDKIIQKRLEDINKANEQKKKLEMRIKDLTEDNNAGFQPVKSPRQKRLSMTELLNQPTSNANRNVPKPNYLAIENQKLVEENKNLKTELSEHRNLVDQLLSGK